MPTTGPTGPNAVIVPEHGPSEWFTIAPWFVFHFSCVRIAFTPLALLTLSDREQLTTAGTVGSGRAVLAPPRSSARVDVAT